ncbi:hypothetical protein Tco_0528372 [Tanacetum coccineum]
MLDEWLQKGNYCITGNVGWLLSIHMNRKVLYFEWNHAEILGLMRSDGIEIQRCYLDYLEALVSHYKAARSSRNPTGGYEGIRRFEDYHGDGNMDGSLAAKEKGRVEHFGITLKEEEEGKHKLMHTSYCQ